MRNLLDSPGRYIMKVSSGLRRQLDSFVAGTSMTNVEARVLQFIAAGEGPVYQRDIEAEYGWSAATVSELMGNMEAKGLVRRETDPEDRRRKRIVIPEAIGPQVSAMRERMFQMEAKLIEGIDEEKIEVFLEVVEKMTGNMPPKGE